MLRYFEICFPDGYSMVIKAMRKPTASEAAEFIAEDMKRLGQTEISEIEEWTREDALTAFDFDNEDKWPVFGAKEDKQHG